MCRRASGQAQVMKLVSQWHHHLQLILGEEWHQITLAICSRSAGLSVQTSCMTLRTAVSSSKSTFLQQRPTSPRLSRTPPPPPPPPRLPFSLQDCASIVIIITALHAPTWPSLLCHYWRWRWYQCLVAARFRLGFVFSAFETGSTRSALSQRIHLPVKCMNSMSLHCILLLTLFFLYKDCGMSVWLKKLPLKWPDLVLCCGRQLDFWSCPALCINRHKCRVTVPAGVTTDLSGKPNSGSVYTYNYTPRNPSYTTVSNVINSVAGAGLAVGIAVPLAAGLLATGLVWHIFIASFSERP